MALRKVAELTAVRVTSVDKLDPGHVTTVERGFDIPIAVGQDISKLAISFPYPWEPEGAKAIVDHGEYDRDDRVYAFATLPGDPNLGLTTAVAAAGQKVVAVDDNLLKHLKNGHQLGFGSDPEHYLVDSIDFDAKTATLDRDIVTEVASGTGVKIRSAFLYNCRPLNGVIETFGEISPGARHMTAGAVLCVEYHHAITPTVVDAAHMRVIYKF
jgi:hypothetical protein